MSDVIRVSRALAIPITEITWRFTASGGPGGQHANTANTKVEARLDLLNSPSLGPRQRARLIERYGNELRVVVSSERSQARNRVTAVERMTARLADGLKIERARTPTKPSRGAVNARLETKSHRGAVKRDRQRPVGDW